MVMALVAQEAHNPVLPENSIVSLLSFLWLLIPVLVVAFVVRQLVLTRRAAERAASQPN